MTQAADISFLRQQMLFMGHPLDIADADRVAALLKPFSADKLRQCPQAWLRLKSWAESHWNLSAPVYDFSANQFSRFLFLPVEPSRHLAAWLGILAFFPVIRKTLKGSILNALKQDLPGCYPDVLRKAQFFGAWQQQLSASVTDSHDLSPLAVRRHGMALLRAFFATFPLPVRQRWLLRFAETESDHLPELNWDTDIESTIALLDMLKQRTLC